MTIVTTIHQPSSQIFYTFDRVILLAEGHTIYNGSTQGTKDFLESLGIKFNKYTNPADLLLKLANDPTLIKEDLTIKSLAW
jgi:ABC-type multidrug transport system ATPase subunit